MPDGQLVQRLALAPAYVPEGQRTHADASDWLLKELKVPAAQNWGVAAPDADT